VIGVVVGVVVLGLIAARFGLPLIVELDSTAILALDVSIKAGAGVLFALECIRGVRLDQRMRVAIYLVLSVAWFGVALADLFGA
jgi:hypothetical protein